MIIFILYLMETFQHLRSLHACLIFLLISTIGKGSACEAPSSPQCFRQNEDETVYICEWDFSTNETDVTFDLHLNDTSGFKIPYRNIKENHVQLSEERLIVGFKVDIWVEAHAGNSTCTSPKRSGILEHTVKYEAPQNITVSWLRNNLSLSWQSEYLSLAEVWFRKHQTESWEKRIINTTAEAVTQKLIVENLLKNTAYEVQVRQQSIQAENPLWSNWSPAVIVPAELEHPPEVRNTITPFNGTRQVTLTWELKAYAAAIRGVTYTVNVTYCSPRCPCKKKSHKTKATRHTVYVSYSAVNITVIARNAAGPSPPAVVHVPAVPAADLKTCDKTLFDEDLKKRTWLEFYELKDADLIPERVWCLTARRIKKERKKIKNDMEDYTRYLYFEHRCHKSKPQTVKMCYYYQKEGAPRKKPNDFKPGSEKHNSADLSWKEFSYEDLRGFLTHYKLCAVKISSQNEPPVCINVSASETKYHLKGLTPGTKYNVSLTGVTQAGEGPVAIESFTTEPEKPLNVWISFGLLFSFFLFSTVCTVIMKRIKSKVFPPVPKPVIPDFSPRHPESEEMWERKERVDELTLHQIVPEERPDPVEATLLTGDWEDGTEWRVEKDGGCSEGSDDRRSSLASLDETQRQAELKDLEQVETELAMLTYKNGLVFGVKSDTLL